MHPSITICLLLPKFTFSTIFSFHWCPNPKCAEDGYGFVDEGRNLRIACPRCGVSIKCRECKKEWRDEHQGLTCDQYATWERENTDEFKEGGK